MNAWKLFVGAFALTLVCGVSSVYAFPKEKSADGDKKKPIPEEIFKKKDTNSDGFLTVEEIIGKQDGEKADKMKKHFMARDKNGDGKLSLDEFKAGGERRKDQKKEKTE